jgi:hypothetical protein
MQVRRYPPVGLQVILVLAYVSLPAVTGAGVITALLVVALQPSAAIWVPVFVLLSVIAAVLIMREFAPWWYAWFRGRPFQRREPPGAASP